LQHHATPRDQITGIRQNIAERAQQRGEMRVDQKTSLIDRPRAGEITRGSKRVAEPSKARRITRIT
jgi:hypothetical protein